MVVASATKATLDTKLKIGVNGKVRSYIQCSINNIVDSQDFRDVVLS